MTTAAPMRPLEPRCASCGKRHRPDLRCWRGRYAQGITRQVLARSRRCWICGEQATSADHEVPRARGGGDEPGNLLPACGTCNSRKGAEEATFTPDQASIDPARLSPRWRTMPHTGSYDTDL